MTPVFDFSAMGFEPVAWSVPNIGNMRGKDGKKGHRFARRSRKTDRGSGRLSLADWQAFIAGEAEKKWAGRPKETSPLHVHFEFFGKTPPGKRHGQLWDVRLVLDKKTGKYTKKNRVGGAAEPDVTNMVKAAEDALNGVVWEDDCNNRFLSVMTFFGPTPGVRIYVNRIDDEDYPGRGEPVA